VRERYRVADLEVDVDGATVWRGAERIVLPPRSFELLVALLRRYPDVVRRRQLLETVWPGEHVTDQTLSHRVMTLRRALGSAGPACVASERGFGYRIAGPVQLLGAGRPPRAASSTRRRVGWGGATLLAVLCAVMTLSSRSRAAHGPDPAALPTVFVRASLGVSGETQPVASALARSLTSGLGRIRGLRVVAWNGGPGRSSLRLEGTSVGTARAMELRLWLLEGETGRLVWSRLLRGDASEVLGQEEALVSATVAAVRERLGTDAVMDELPPRVRHLCERADLAWLTWTAGGLQASTAAWERAVGFDPGCASAFAGWSLAESTAALLGYRLPEEAERGAREHARRALDIDAALAAGQAATALVRLLFDFDLGGAERLATSAARASPEDARTAIVLALVLRAEGRLEESGRLLLRAADDDPSSAGLLFLQAQNLQAAARWDEAAAVYARALALEPTLSLAQRHRAECLTAAGRPAEALVGLGEKAPLPGVARDAALREAWRRICVAQGAGPEEALRACLSCGELARAATALAAGLDEHRPFVVFVLSDAADEPLRETRAYQALRSRLGRQDR
jgi:DNA-binding winged helix-turn-helix (wHTH) protein/tetratricopeptide (TPR) repeat protein